MKKIINLIVIIFFAGKLFAQESLPGFTIADRGDKVIISWINAYESVIQLNVQRSFDSLKNFTTIYSATSPGLPQNGYTDVKPPLNRIFYRIFYVLQGGSYFFSPVKKADGTTYATASPNRLRDDPASRDLTSPALARIFPGDKRMVTIIIKDTVFKQVGAVAFRNFRDSILRHTKDTLYSINDTLVGVNPFIIREAVRTSLYVYINKDGYINISVPLVNERKYNVKFFEEDGTSLFEIHSVRETPLILDKANFVHSGWFLFELYEDNKLKEKNKLYVPKDF